MPNRALAAGSNHCKCPPRRGNPWKEGRWDPVALLRQQEERCVSTDTPPHTHFPSQQHISRDSGKSQGWECLLNQCPLHMELHKLLNQSEREVSAWGLTPARATSHTHRVAPAWPRSAALSHPECRLPSSVCIFMTSPSSGPNPGRKLCLTWMKGVCSSLLPSSPDSKEDELLPRALGAYPSLARLQQRWPHRLPWGSQGEMLVAVAPQSIPRGPVLNTSAEFQGVKVLS